MPSNSTELFGLIAFFAFAALVIHSLWQASKRVPPATDRLPAGVDGALLAVAGLAAEGETDVGEIEAAEVTYPDFVRDFRALGADFELIPEND